MPVERAAPLLAYVLCWFVLVGIAVLIVRRGPGGEPPFWLEQVAILFFVAQLAAVLLILGGTFDPGVLATVTAGYEIAAVLKRLLVRIAGRSTFADEYWFLYDARKRDMRGGTLLWLESVVLQAFALLAPLVVPSAAYLFVPRGPELAAWLLTGQLAWVLIFLVRGYLQNASILLSVAVTSRVRAFLVARQIAQVAPVAMWVAVLSWAFGITGPQVRVSVAGNVVSMSTAVVSAAAVFLVAAVVPYLVGELRSSRTRHDYATRLSDLEESLLKIVMIPQRTRFPADLHEFGLRLNKLQRALAEEAPLVKGFPQVSVSYEEWASLLSRGRLRMWTAIDAEALERDLKKAYAELEAEDPRFKHWRRSGDLGDWTSELVQRSRSHEPSEQVYALAKSVAEELQRRLADQTDATGDSRTGRAPAIAALGFVASAVVGVLLDQFGEWVWESVVKSVSV